MIQTDVLIIGAGLAGLACAWQIRDRSVTIIRPGPDDGASFVARGGIAAALGEDDGPRHHIDDTLACAGGLAEPQMVEILANEGIDRLIDLIECSVGFDRDDDGRLCLGQEAMHSRARIVHVAGDDTGYHVTTAVRQMVEARSNISFIDGEAVELVADDGRVCAAIVDAKSSGPTAVVAASTVLATGGVGGLFEKTTNPTSARAEGLAMAARAGATLADLEFVQFHPTALHCPQRPLPLLSEAIRGQGGRLCDSRGRAVMSDHPRGDLAGRDIIARTLWRRIDDGDRIFLDTTVVDDFCQQFPAAASASRSAGFAPNERPVPVTPAAHYHMGGVATDDSGRTDLSDLWAVGEVASTGVHGANRLASNSLLEALVFGARAGRAIAAGDQTYRRAPLDRIGDHKQAWQSGQTDICGKDRIYRTISSVMWRQVGIERSEHGLREAIAEFDDHLQRLDYFDRRRLAVEAARAIAVAAEQRTESRGAHFRLDYPRRDPSLCSRKFVDTSTPTSSRFELSSLSPIKP